MKDVVVGCITNYNFDKIKPWVNSLDRSGFTGDKVMLAYNVDYETVNELYTRGYTIFTFGRDENKKSYVYNKRFNIVVERFLHMSFCLRQLTTKYRYLITTDVKDVVFQTNPSVWLENNLGDKEINVATESIRYKDEDWGINNLLNSFGVDIASQLKDNLIYNCGTLSGKFDSMLDLFLNIYMLCNGTSHTIEGGGGPDQAALNVLLNMKAYKDITKFNMSEDGWAAQLGTTGPQIFGKYGEKLVEKTPIMCDNVVCTSTGVPFPLVHQYDRVPEWNDIILNKFYN